MTFNDLQNIDRKKPPCDTCGSKVWTSLRGVFDAKKGDIVSTCSDCPAKEEIKSKAPGIIFKGNTANKSFI